MKKIISFSLTLAAIASSLVVNARADEVTDWNQTLFQTSLVAGSDTLTLTRVAAIVQTAVFDAVNGVDRRYTPVRVNQLAPVGASARAAAVQAAYATLVKLYPAQQASLDARRTSSLALLSGGGLGNTASVAAGIDWGQKVADEILAWRSTDGLAQPLPPFLGGSDAGMWCPTPPLFIPAVGQQFSRMTPWVIESPSQFRPAGPPALTSARHAAHFNEVKIRGASKAPFAPPIKLYTACSGSQPADTVGTTSRSRFSSAPRTRMMTPATTVSAAMTESPRASRGWWPRPGS